MASPLPQHPQLRGNFAPINFEAAYRDLVVEGTLPEGLSGSLYRIGPNPKFAPSQGYHWFFGAGMVHAFHFSGGRVDYVNRWARTPKFEAEWAAGGSLPMSFMTDPETGAIQSDRRNGLANTHIVWHADQLLALEEGSHPFSLAPDTLDSLGYGHYADDIAGPMTAHPKIDPLTGELHGFGYMSDAMGSPAMTYHVVDAQGRVKRSDTFTAPYAAMVHDFAVTRDYVLFPIFPLTFDLARMADLGSPFAFESSAGAFIGVLERDAPVSQIRWIEAPVCFVFHYLNAWNEGGLITFDAIDFPVAPNFPDINGQLPRFEDAQGKLTRWKLDLRTAQIDREVIWDVSSEFPRIDDRYAMAQHRHGFLATASTRQRGDGGLFHEISHFDFNTGNQQTWDAGVGNGVSEPVFVASGKTEGEGWLLATVYDAERHASALVVLDALAVANGPVATAHLDHRIPFGFHGSWRQSS
ncbi:MAG: carotenoid oxygenase family protein [Halieaceae bacterium]